MTFQVIQQTTRYDRTGNKIISRKEEVLGSFDTAGFAREAAEIARFGFRDARRDTVTLHFFRHSSGRDTFNETEMMWREMMDDATIDRIFPIFDLPI